MGHSQLLLCTSGKGFLSNGYWENWVGKFRFSKHVLINMLGESWVKLYSSEVLLLSVKCNAISTAPHKPNAGKDFWNFCICLVWNACSGCLAQGRVFYSALKKSCGMTSPLHKVPQKVMVRLLLHTVCLGQHDACGSAGNHISWKAGLILFP